ncbi:hypothetical protein [Geodermatophilus sp. SYSU D00766]
MQAAAVADGRVRLWGSTPTAQARNEKAVALEERRVGDWVFFYAEKAFIARARIAHLLRNRRLAEAVWGQDEDAATWEHVMVLRDVEYAHIPSDALLEPIGRNPVVRGLALLSASDSAAVLGRWSGAATTPPQLQATAVDPVDGYAPAPNALDVLRPLVGLPLPTTTGGTDKIVGLNADGPVVTGTGAPKGRHIPIRQVQAGLDLLFQRGRVRIHVNDLGLHSGFVGAVLATLPDTSVSRTPARVILESDGEPMSQDPFFATLDGSTTVKFRKEQTALRRVLVGDRETAECALCGGTFRVEFLVAAHIKRRSLCSDTEKADLPNVAMLACLFGCDALYEAGYLSVDEAGTVVAASFAGLPDAMAHRLEALRGNQCSAHTRHSADYFDWHRTNIFRRSAVLRA